MLKATKVEVKPFILEDFIDYKEQAVYIKKIEKSNIKTLAKALNLEYDNDKIVFAQKLINAYIDEIHIKR